MKPMDKIRVLLVESNANVRNGLVSFLETRDQMVLVGEAANGPEALRLCHLSQPDVILLDFAVTGLDAVALIRLVRQLDNQIQVIVLASSEKDNQRIQAGLEAGAAIALQKNISASKLTDAIETTYASRTIPPKRRGDPQIQDS